MARELHDVLPGAHLPVMGGVAHAVDRAAGRLGGVQPGRHRGRVGPADPALDGGVELVAPADALVHAPERSQGLPLPHGVDHRPLEHPVVGAGNGDPSAIAGPVVVVRHRVLGARHALVRGEQFGARSDDGAVPPAGGGPDADSRPGPAADDERVDRQRRVCGPTDETNGLQLRASDLLGAVHARGRRGPVRGPLWRDPSLSGSTTTVSAGAAMGRSLCPYPRGTVIGGSWWCRVIRLLRDQSISWPPEERRPGLPAQMERACGTVR